MIGGNRTRTLNTDVDGNFEKAVVKKYAGQTTEEILQNVEYQMHKIKPETVIIIAGSNDVSEGFRTKSLDTEFITNNIFNVARRAKNFGANKVVISGLFIRKSNFIINEAIHDINQLLLSKCEEEGFYFMDQTNIDKRHLVRDGLHLNRHGSYILRMNILNFFSTFNPHLCSFIDDYNRAI